MLLNKNKKKLLEEETLTLDKVKTIARTYELSKTQAKRMEPHVDEPINEEVNRMGHTQPSHSMNQGVRPKKNKQTSRPPRQRSKHRDRRKSRRQFVIVVVTVVTRDSHVKRQKKLHVTHVVGKNISQKCANQRIKMCMFF